MRETFGSLIRARRERLGLKGYELAARLEKQDSLISRLETDSFKDTPSPELMSRIESVLGISVREQLEAIGYQIEKPATSCAEASPAYDASDPRMRDFAARIAALPATKDLLWFLEANVPLLEKLAREAKGEG